MEATYAAIVAVLGTLLGSVTTHLLERRTTAERAAAERHDRLRDEQLSACSAFAGALTELKRAVITLWFRRHGSQAPEERRDAWVDADRLGAAAEAARFRMLLVLDDPTLVGLADRAFSSLEDIKAVVDRDDLVDAERRFSEVVTSFVAAASRVLRPTAS